MALVPLPQRKLLSESEEQLKNLERKFLLGNSIGEDIYFKYRNEIEPEILNRKGIIAELESRLSNHDIFMGKAIEVCQNISKHWEFGDTDNRQRIQKVVFPEGLVIVPENRVYLTDNMNQVFSLIPCLQSISEGVEKEKASKIADLSLSVAKTGVEPVTSGL